VTEKLNNIPACAIINKEGRPLIVPTKAKDSKTDIGVIPVFTDGALAAKNYAEFQKSAPDVSKLYQIVPIRLGEAFDAARQEKKNKDSKIQYFFQASPDFQKKALAIVKKGKSDIKEFPWIPVFFLGKAGQPVIFKRGSEQTLPFFFSETDLQKQWEILKKTKPDMASKAEIEVASLYQILDFMLDAKNDKDSQAITFVPDEQALKFVDEFQGKLPKDFISKPPETKPETPAGETKPDAAPAAPAPAAPKPDEAPKP